MTEENPRPSIADYSRFMATQRNKTDREFTKRFRRSDIERWCVLVQGAQLYMNSPVPLGPRCAACGLQEQWTFRGLRNALANLSKLDAEQLGLLRLVNAEFESDWLLELPEEPTRWPPANLDAPRSCRRCFYLKGIETGLVAASVIEAVALGVKEFAPSKATRLALALLGSVTESERGLDLDAHVFADFMTRLDKDLEVASHDAEWFVELDGLRFLYCSHSLEAGPGSRWRSSKIHLASPDEEIHLTEHHLREAWHLRCRWRVLVHGDPVDDGMEPSQAENALTNSTPAGESTSSYGAGLTYPGRAAASGIPADPLLPYATHVTLKETAVSEVVIAGLARAARLECLSFEACSLEVRSFDSLRALGALSTLKFVDTDLDEPASTALKRLPHLKTVYLDGRRLGDKAVATLAGNYSVPSRRA